MSTAPVTFGASGTANTLAPVSAAQGVYVESLASLVAEQKTITATVGAGASAFSKTAEVVFVSGAASAARSSLVAAPAALPVDTPSALTLTLLDTNGNPISGAPATLTASGGATLTPAAQQTDAHGQLAATLVSSVAQPVAVMASAGGLTLHATVSFVPGAFSAATSSLAISPGMVAADGIHAATISVIARDSESNALAGQPIVLSVSGSGNSLQPSAGAIGPNGTFTATLTSTAAQVKTVTALVAGGTLTGATTFTAGAPAAALSTLVANPLSFAAGATTAVQLRLLDAFGNPVSGQAVTLSASGAGNTFSGNGQSGATLAGTTDANGLLAASLLSTTAQQETVSATLAGQQTALLSAPITVTAVPQIFEVALAASPGQVTADGSSTTTLSVSVDDLTGRPVAGQAVTLSASGAANTFSAAGLTAGATLTGTTNAQGAFTAQLSSTAAQSEVVSATAGQSSASVGVVFVAGAPSSTQSTLTAAGTQPVVADQSATYALTLTVRDAQGNPVPGVLAQMKGTASGDVFAPAGVSGSSVAIGSTGPAGTFAATVSAEVAGTQTITAYFGGAQLTASIAFAAGPASALCSSIAWTNSASAISADGASPANLTISAADKECNPVSGAAFALSTNPAVASDVFSGANQSTGANGQATATLATIQPGAQTVLATFASFSVQTQVSFVAPAPVAAQSSLAASPASVAVNGGTTTITATLLDSFREPVASYSQVCISDAFGLISSCGSTNANGAFSVALTPSTCRTGADTLTATITGASNFTLTSSVTLTGGAPSAGSSSFTTSSTKLTVGQQATLTLTLKDACGNLSPTQPVSFSGAGPLDVLAPASGVTNASGVLTTQFGSGALGARTATASFSGGSLSVQVTFSPPACAFTEPESVSLQSQPDQPPTGTATALVSGDFNGDGIPDLAAAAGYGGIQVFLGGGKGAFSLLGSFDAQDYPADLGVGDFNRDGKLDLVSGTYAEQFDILLGDGKGDFSVSNSYSVSGMYPYSVAVADFNGDGKLDLAGVSGGSSSIVLELGNGDGTFHNGTLFTIPTSQTASRILAGDFNGDTKPDIIALVGGQMNVFLGNGDGTFQAAIADSASGLSGDRFAVGDFNGDNKLDYLAYQQSGCGAVLGLGNGAGGFTHPGSRFVSSPCGGSFSVYAADVNLDNKLDAVVVRDGSGAFVYFGNGDGTFQGDAGTPLSVALDPGGPVAIADYTGDGKPDLAGMVTTLKVLAGGGAADTFQLVGSAPDYGATFSPIAVATGDFNGDGAPDVVLGSKSHGLDVLLNKGDGTLGMASTLGGSASAYAIAVADVNGDGEPDIAVGNGSANKISLLFGNGDGTFAYQGEINAPLASGANLVVGDFNGDNKADLAIASPAANTECCGDGPTTDTEVVLGNGDGTFQSPVSYSGPSTGTPTALAAGDLNGDGILDLALAWTGNQGSISFGKGTGAFFSPLTYLAGNGADAIAIADMNHDGWPDVIIANGSDDDVAVYLASPVCW